jgi:tol-pal system protein YbgF
VGVKLSIAAIAAIAAGLLTACGPSTSDLEVRRLAAQVEALSSQLGREAARVADLSQQLVVLGHDRSRAAVAEPTGVEPTPALRVVRLTPEPEPEFVEAPPVQLVLRGDEPVPPKSAGSALRAATEAFHRGLEAYQRGDTDSAYVSFRTFVDRYPTHVDADSARFWMGQCKLDAGAYAQAVAEFGRLREAYPASAKVPDALLKAGLAYEKLREGGQAQAMFSLLVDRFPDSAPAELARARLQWSSPEVAHGDD